MRFGQEFFDIVLEWRRFLLRRRHPDTFTFIASGAGSGKIGNHSGKQTQGREHRDRDHQNDPPRGREDVRGSRQHGPDYPGELAAGGGRGLVAVRLIRTGRLVQRDCPQKPSFGRTPVGQQLTDLVGRLKAIVGILGHHLPANLHQVRRGAGTLLGNAAGLPGLMLDDPLVQRPLGKRRVAGEQEVERTPQRVYVRPVVQIRALEALFRGLVVDGPQDLLLL